MYRECNVICVVCGQESKRAYVIPSRVEPLYKCYYHNGLVCALALAFSPLVNYDPVMVGAVSINNSDVRLCE